MDVHTHSSHTQRDLQSRFGREKTHQRFKLQQIVKKNLKRYLSNLASFEEDNEKAQYASFKHIFI